MILLVLRAVVGEQKMRLEIGASETFQLDNELFACGPLKRQLLKNGEAKSRRKQVWRLS